jgi:MFS family permease
MISKQIATKNIKLQTWINFLSGVLFLLPVFGALQQIIGLSILEMVIIANVGSIVVWVFELPTSVFADTVGRKLSLVISLVCNFISAIVILIYPSYI